MTHILLCRASQLWWNERGNQREKDRERAQARAGGKNKQTKNDGLTPEQRKERDAKALQEKAAKKAAQAAGGNNAGTREKCGCSRNENVKMNARQDKIQNDYIGGNIGMTSIEEILEGLG
ncbi:hypothetical protein CR513_31195, partial [Mucuna pruriens]